MSDFSVSFDNNGKFDEIIKNSDKSLTDLIINNKEIEDDTDTIFVKKNKILFITKNNLTKYLKED
jgi:succinate dehydrogenase flavin-adding protein (antitoxin of CptAB toxin-antitoxin module)